MALLKKVVVQWSGATGLPGVSIFYATGVSTNPVGDLNTFFTGLRPFFPTGLTWVIPGAGDTIDENTGHLNALGWTSTGGGTLVASGGATANAGGTGMKVVWNTAGLTPKFRKVRGHTNLTSLISTSYTSTGQIQAGTQSTVQGLASALAATGNWVIWHRNTPGSSNGFSAAITSATVPIQVISLRSRRY